MKTRFFSKAFFAALTALATAACTADDFEGEGRPQTQVRTLSIEVTTSSPETRAEYATSGGTIRETFSDGDQIGVYGLNGTEVIADNVKFTMEDGKWIPEADVIYSSEYTYYAYYPYKASATLSGSSCTFDSSAPAEDTDDSSDKFAAFISHWPIAADQSTKEAFRTSDLLASRGENQTIPVVRFTMAHKLAMVELVPSYNYWYYSHDTSAAQTMGVEFVTNIPYELDGNFYYIMRPGVNTTVGGQTTSATSGKFYYKRFDTISGSYTLSYSTNNGASYSSTKPTWLNITEYDNGSGHVAFKVAFNASSTGSVTTTLPSGTVSDYDLSTHDVNGKACSQTTANSYMIHKGGTYKLPLVYGNAIRNGATNTQAFWPEGSGADFLSPFMSALGNDINDPWIKNVDETPTTAELLWQDANRVVTAVGVSGDYMTFTVPESAPCGNAVIAVRGASNKILWSWHIWACPDWYKTASMTPVKSDGYTYNVAPVNLGWVGSFSKKTYDETACIVKVTPASGATQIFKVPLPATEEYTPTSYGYCPYYQWGRKDPEQPSTGNANSAHAVYNVSGGAGTALSHSSSSVPISTTIQNPTVHYYNSSNNGPYNTNQYNLWDANEYVVTNSGNKTGHTVKTVYDPCPPGYCVPRGNLYYHITGGGTQTEYATWNGSYYFRTWTRDWPAIHFPAAGGRYYGSGTSIDNVTSYGYCWASSAYSTSSARYLYLYGSSFYWGSRGRAYGLTVRPVQENY